jgi:hypothetical protein
MLRSSWGTALKLIFCSTLEWFERSCPGGKPDNKEMSLNKLRSERERPMKVIALVGAVWLVTLSGAAAYAPNTPAPANAAAYGQSAPPHVIGRSAC